MNEGAKFIIEREGQGLKSGHIRVSVMCNDVISDDKAGGSGWAYCRLCVNHHNGRFL